MARKRNNKKDDAKKNAPENVWDKVEKKDLVLVAEEINDLMGLEPAIKTDRKATKESIYNDISGTVSQFEEDDELTQEAIDIMITLEFDLPDSMTGGADEGADEGDDEGADEGADEGDDEGDDEKEKKPARGGRRGGKKDSGKASGKDSGKDDEKPKKKANKGPSAYATMLDILCDDPGITKDEFRKAMDKTKIEYKDSAFNTAYSSANSIFKRLRENKLLKK